ncbi:probable t-SNARE VTI1 [Nakaseomyces glabratus]|nr:probable t-SNARE VTI1 [Nakaseomyces glabratus]SLM12426.1 probable t-SNARE VTI1 [Nakaseomyces glabratus]
MSLLVSYESDFKATLDQGKAALVKASAQSLPERNATLKQIEEQKDELYDLLDQMALEVNNSIRDWKTQVNQELKEPLQKLLDTRDKDELFGAAARSGANGNIDVEGMSEEQRQQLLSNHAILQKSGDKLRDASRLANETEGIGSQIMMDLRSQRETLENARDTLFQADSYVDKSIKTLKVMSRRLIANKAISYAIIAVLVLLIILVIFSKFR